MTDRDFVDELATRPCAFAIGDRVCAPDASPPCIPCEARRVQAARAEGDADVHARVRGLVEKVQALLAAIDRLPLAVLTDQADDVEQAIRALSTPAPEPLTRHLCTRPGPYPVEEHAGGWFVNGLRVDCCPSCGMRLAEISEGYVASTDIEAHRGYNAAAPATPPAPEAGGDERPMLGPWTRGGDTGPARGGFFRAIAATGEIACTAFDFGFWRVWRPGESHPVVMFDGEGDLPNTVAAADATARRYYRLPEPATPTPDDKEPNG